MKNGSKCMKRKYLGQLYYKWEKVKEYKSGRFLHFT